MHATQVVIAGTALPASIQPDAIVNTFFNAGLMIAALFFRVSLLLDFFEIHSDTSVHV